MTFVATENNTRLVDPARGAELLRDESPTGSSGYLSFRLVAPKVDWQFYAKLTSVATLERSQDPADANRLVWLIFSMGSLHLPEQAEVRGLIEEAMIAFRSWFGLGQPDWTYRVMIETGSKEGER